jgi:hypothetical protein
MSHGFNGPCRSGKCCCRTISLPERTVGSVTAAVTDRVVTADNPNPLVWNMSGPAGPCASLSGGRRCCVCPPFSSPSPRPPRSGATMPLTPPSAPVLLAAADLGHLWGNFPALVDLVIRCGVRSFANLICTSIQRTEDPLRNSISLLGLSVPRYRVSESDSLHY